MTGTITNTEFERHLQPRARHRRMPRISLRQRSSDHPMVMFALLVSAGFVSMALMMPASGATLAAPHGAPARIAAEQEPMPSPRSDVDGACVGQAWGSQDEACLAAISKASGREGKTIRMVSAEPLKTAPNIF